MFNTVKSIIIWCLNFGQKTNILTLMGFVIGSLWFSRFSLDWRWKKLQLVQGSSSRLLNYFHNWQNFIKFQGQLKMQVLYIYNIWRKWKKISIGDIFEIDSSLSWRIFLEKVNRYKKTSYHYERFKCSVESEKIL